jgi:putative transposase
MGAGEANQRNGVTAKTVLSGDGKIRIETPRDRDGSFEPLLLPKPARRFTAFDDNIVALYARGLIPARQKKDSRRVGRVD